MQSDGVANAGFYDQRLALEWVKAYAHLFGGDKNRVTLMGQSAGGGSILHHITAYGGPKADPPLFQQAILQSAGWLPFPSSLRQEELFTKLLRATNTTSLAELRALPSSALIAANTKLVTESGFTGGFGPVVDGLYAPDVPGRLLAQGSFDPRVKVMVGYNSLDGPHFADPRITDDAAFEAFTAAAFPDATPRVIRYIADELYPPVFDGSLWYRNQFERAALAVQDVAFYCNGLYLDRAFGNRTFAYEFAVPPGLHGQDVAYTFANGPSEEVVSPAVAAALQAYIVSFVEDGRPSATGIPRFPMYESESKVMVLNATSIEERTDPLASARCAWWQKALYY